MSPSKVKYGLLALLFAGFAIRVWLTDIRPYENRQLQETEHLHIRMDGIVTKIVNTGNGNIGVISLRLAYSNIPELLENDSVHHYWCLIKNDKAKFINSIDGIEVGDSLNIITDRNLIKVYRNGSLKERSSILYVIRDEFYSKVRPLMKL